MRKIVLSFCFITLLLITLSSTKVNASSQSRKEALEEAKILISDYDYYWSKKEVVETLIDFGHSKSDSKYAANSLKVNWKKYAYNYTVNDFLVYNITSKKGLHKELKRKGFTVSEINYAYKKLNWKHIARDQSELISDSSYGYSKKAMKKKLKKYGYTTKEINYAISHANINWKKQAYKHLNSYRYMSLSCRELYEKLLHDGFSRKEAEYAIEKYHPYGYHYFY